MEKGVYQQEERDSFYVIVRMVFEDFCGAVGNALDI